MGDESILLIDVVNVVFQLGVDTVRATNDAHNEVGDECILLIDVVNVVFQLGVDTVRATNMTHTMKWVMSVYC